MNILQKILGGGTLGRALSGFSTRALLIVVGSLFFIDLWTPDPVPLIDEVVLGGMTLLLARWSMRRDPAAAPEGLHEQDTPKPPPKNATPR